jgi:hypothetical protein
MGMVQVRVLKWWERWEDREWWWHIFLLVLC